MDITPPLPAGKLVIQRYGNGGFRIANTLYTHPVLITFSQVFPWDVSVTSLSESHFIPFTKEVPEILLIGMGKSFVPLSPALKSFFRAHNISADVMDTGAACRTYNVLLSEDRRVSAALLPV